MNQKVTAQEVVSRLPELLERVHEHHETFVILVDGQEIGQLSPVPPSQPVATFGSFFELMKANRPDPGYAGDLEEIQEAQRPRATERKE